MPDYSLGRHFEQFVEAQVRSGRFHDADEVLRAGLRLLEAREAERSARAAQLARAINDAFDERGPDIPAEDVFDRLEAEFAADMKAAARGA
ncbi:type II toxin-antitoxin system ParD family antitoxin [Methylosinus sp. Sm6]|uniref:type II toxin-antitoxin system ParD family antitoxin n=1 Tax=Methylosinus sp. Sm6 TaxID=2866948 RepID=UPI001C9A1AA5|nr:type II toxin-antitoxin system ParD family antitoxin [Methylosinus sp. Sm6]MBY6239637.1 type II toxin-antitoxin system ParD family antitoxin [Methylosinus sp. Sm6]